MQLCPYSFQGSGLLIKCDKELSCCEYAEGVQVIWVAGRILLEAMNDFGTTCGVDIVMTPSVSWSMVYSTYTAALQARLPDGAPGVHGMLMKTPFEKEMKRQKVAKGRMEEGDSSDSADAIMLCH